MTKRVGSPPGLSAGSATAPLMIGAISATSASSSASVRAWNTTGRPCAQAALGERDHLDHPPVGSPRRLAEGEDAVLLEHDQAFDFGVALERFGDALRELKPRHHVRHPDERSP